MEYSDSLFHLQLIAEHSVRDSIAKMKGRRRNCLFEKYFSNILLSFGLLLKFGMRSATYAAIKSRGKHQIWKVLFGRVLNTEAAIRRCFSK